MNVKQLNATMPTSFECQALNDEGEWVTGTVNIVVNRLSFRETSQEKFQKAMENAHKDPVAIGELLAKCVVKWDIFTDEANTEMLPITVENIIDQPVDFTMALAEAVVAKLVPNPPKADSSRDGSARTDRLTPATKTLKAGTTSQ